MSVGIWILKKSAITAYPKSNLVARKSFTFARVLFSSKCNFFSTTGFEFWYTVTAFYFSLRNAPDSPLFEFMYWRNFSTHNFTFLWSGITCQREIYSVSNIYIFHLIWKDQGEISVLLVPRTKKSNCKTLSWLIDVSFIEEIPLCNQERAEICLVDYFERPFVLSATRTPEY